MTTTLEPAAAPRDTNREPENDHLESEEEPDQFDETECGEDDEDAGDDRRDATGNAGEEAEREGVLQGAPIVRVPIPPPEPRNIVGLVRGLAEMVADTKGTLILAIAMLGPDQILVTIQPPPPTGDKAPELPALQVKGSPTEIDEQLLGALRHYVPAVEFAVKTAEQIAAEATAAATAARTSAQKRPTPVTTPRPSATGRFTRLTVKVKPKTATLAVVDADGKAQEVVVGKPATLPRGKYTITATADGFETKAKSVTLNGYSQATSLELSSNVGFLTIKTTPKGSTVRVVDAKGDSHDVQLRTRTKLLHGKYIVEVSAPNFESQTLAATVGATPGTLEVTLTERPSALFDMK